MTQKIYEKNIPGTSAKLFFSFIPLFVYLKHHSSLIPTPHILYENPKMVSKITIPNNFSSKYITSNLEESLSIDDIFIIVSDNQFYGIGKVVKQNKRKVIEIIFQINDPIYKFLIEKYGEPRLLIENASVEEEKTRKIQEIDDDKTQTNETKIDDDQSINEALSPEEILYRTAIKVLKYHITKKDLPLEPSKFLNLLMKHRGEYFISIQTTSYKQISNFLDFLYTKKLIIFKIHPNLKRKMITEVDFDILRESWITSSSSSEDESPEVVANAVAENIETLYSLPIELCEILSKLYLLYDYRRLYTKKEVKNILAQYIRVYTDSDNDSQVSLDNVLKKAFSLTFESVYKSSLFELLDAMMIKKYLIKNPNQPLKYSVKNSIPFIFVNHIRKKVNKFNGFKHFVIIEGFMFYEIKAEDLCYKLKAIGNSVFCSKNNTVKFLGKNTHEVVDIFINQYKIPRDFIKQLKIKDKT